MDKETLQVISITEALDEIRTKILESNENLKKSVMETVLRIKNPNCVMIKDSDMRKIANTLIQVAIMDLYGPEQINTKGLNITIEDEKNYLYLISPTEREVRKMDSTQENSKKEITNKILNGKIQTVLSDYLDALDCRIQATKKNPGANLAEINDGIRVINHIVQIMARTSTH